MLIIAYIVWHYEGMMFEMNMNIIANKIKTN